MSLIGDMLQRTKPQPAGGDAAAPGAASDILDVTDASFLREVVEESRRRPVVIDFWAPWCGPCRQLTPALEKAVRAAKGAVRLAKINIDENPQIANQFRVQSIPAVFVVEQGQAFQGFMGALPESQVKAFIEKLAGPAQPGDLEAFLDEAKAALAEGDVGGAAQMYAQALQLEPENLKAIAGLARCYLAGGDRERARETLAMAPAGAHDPDLASVKAALTLGEGAPGAGELALLEARVKAAPDDHAARFDLARGLAGQGRLEAAVDHLLAIVQRDRAWRDDAARKELLTVLEAAGPGSELAKSGRRRLSAILFS